MYEKLKKMDKKSRGRLIGSALTIAVATIGISGIVYEKNPLREEIFQNLIQLEGSSSHTEKIGSTEITIEGYKGMSYRYLRLELESRGECITMRDYSSFPFNKLGSVNEFYVNGERIPKSDWKQFGNIEEEMDNILRDERFNLKEKLEEKIRKAKEERVKSFQKTVETKKRLIKNLKDAKDHK